MFKKGKKDEKTLQEKEAEHEAAAASASEAGGGASRQGDATSTGKAPWATVASDELPRLICTYIQSGKLFREKVLKKCSLRP